MNLHNVIYNLKNIFTESKSVLKENGDAWKYILNITMNLCVKET